jgi:DNA-directed RNA polymerase I subunit RPA1
MSLTTNFNFKGFQCDLSRESAEKKLGVSMSALTSAEMQRLGFVKVRARLGTEDRARPWRPVIEPKTGNELATFWDTRMGNFDVKSIPTQPCTTCAIVEKDAKGANPRCPGHFGYIEMPLRGPGNWLLVYNPILFPDMLALTQATCFFCHKFRAPAWDTTRYECALELVDAGLVGEALHLLHTYPTASTGKNLGGKKLRDAKAFSIHDLGILRDHTAAALKQGMLGGAIVADEPDSTTGTQLGEDGAAVAKAPRQPHPSVMDLRSKMVGDALRELRSYSLTCAHCGAISPKMTSKHSQIYFKFSNKALETNKLLSYVSQQKCNEWQLEREVHRRERQLLLTDDCCKMLQDLCGTYPDTIERLFPNLGSATVPIPYRNTLPPSQAFQLFFLDRVLVPPLPLRLASGIQIQPNGAISADDRTRELNDILKYVEQIEEYYRLSAAGQSTIRQLVANEGNVKSLQLKVDAAYQAVLDRFSKKEGLYRMHMMGKRVNQACRSVISPDFTVEPNEVLLPRPFARNLTFPEAVSFLSPARVNFLTRCVINGPHKYPGATHIERREADGKVDISPLDGTETSRAESAQQYFALAKTGTTIIVHRHIVDGDRLIFNRQPTLHRPSMQSYQARVLSNLKTLRFHYVSGKAFNADFDGDEMNVHIPQSVEARAELECIMDANMNFLVATSGRPLRGLIQDHLAAGVLLTVSDTFFNAEDFHQLLFASLEPYVARGSVTTPISKMIPVPAILKPKPLWTGKQLVSVITKWVTGVFHGNSGVTTRARASVPANAWTSNAANKGKVGKIPDEHGVVFIRSEMLTGVLDKNQLGPSHLSVPHIIHELYGPHAVGDFFGAVARLLTYFLRRQGFSMGVDDMIMLDADGRRQKLAELDVCALSAESEDAAVQAIGAKASAITNEYIPNKLAVPFPNNQLILMTLSGAKGSNVNATQMALLLGQQLFDGVRVKRMSSGKTLPGFFSGENRARSFGFAMGRFMTGIRPQEYTIHSMAGRDGLIDTGVKTSRSGYLQRCLIKGMESLTVHWDGTVRDSDGSVVQFAYGGDGLDPTRISILSEWQTSSYNIEDLAKRFAGDGPGSGTQPVKDTDPDGDFEERWGSEVPTCFKELDPLEQYLGSAKLPAPLKKSLAGAQLKTPMNPRAIIRANKKGKSIEEVRQTYVEAKRAELELLTIKKLPRCKVDPGEAVGILAAQAAGEPSTQMTLNTFHQAGQTASHVTEGIPRLRELLIHASVSNPAVIVPVVNIGGSDLVTIQTILAAAIPVELKSAFATVKEPFKWCVQTGPVYKTVTVIAMFSSRQLERIRNQLLLDAGEMKISFFDALKEFGRIFVRTLRGVWDTKGGGAAQAEQDAGAAAEMELMNAVVQDPADMDGGAAEGEEDSLVGEEDLSDMQSAPHRSPLTKSLEMEEAEEEPSSESESDADGESEAAASDVEPDAQPKEKKATTKKKETLKSTHQTANGAATAIDEDDDEEEAYAGDKKAALRKASYKAFPPLESSYEKKLVRVSIAPENIPGLAEDFVPIRFTVQMPARTVAIIPSAIDAALSVRFGINSPQFEISRWAPNKKNDGGDLIFQGPGTSLKNVMSLLLPFTAECPGIQVYRATSTNYHDVANSLGIEAAYVALSKELGKLFSRYSVDEHHMSLMADNATRRGRWESYNFTGLIAHDPSPIFQMTFGSSSRFLHTAISRGIPDTLTSLSSAIVVGEKPRVGTACVDVQLHPAVLGEVVERRP